ncbi:homoserine kinase [Alteromonas flava]|uniref:homoserine kinase n=1 Tax=Alteromonas flava TaxID=2048003 RepID=UPI000C28B99B|nr:homoserine kinase [Alteromonas flava]
MSSSQSAPVTAYSPASIGNISLGFDILGAAIEPIDGTQLGDSVRVESASETRLTVSGKFANRLPGAMQDNIVMQCYHYYAEQLAKVGQALPSLALHLEKRLPIGSGLGSSAASIVAGLTALNEFMGQKFSADQLLNMMAELEGRISGSIHYDNVAPAYLGGITLMTGDNSAPCRVLPNLKQWYWVVCYSGLSVSTAAARDILPTEYPRADVLTFGRQVGVFIDALHRQDAASAARVIHDVIAEPWRKQLLPGFDAAREATLALGGLAFGISGSGPTVFCVSDELSKAETIKAYLEQHYVQNDDGFSHICTVPAIGARTE